MGTVLDAIDDDDDDAPSSSFASRWRRRRNRLLACSKSFFFFATTTTTRRLFRSRGGRGFAGRRRRRRREECIIIIIFFFFFFVERGSRRGSLQTDVRAERGETHRVRDLSKADRRFFGEQQRRTSHGGREGKAARKGEQRDDRHRRGGKETARNHRSRLCLCDRVCSRAANVHLPPTRIRTLGSFSVGVPFLRIPRVGTERHVKHSASRRLGRRR